jgi:hypothetical protein
MTLAANQRESTPIEWAMTRLRLWKRWTTYSGCAFALTAAIVALFLKGAPLHESWNSIGVPLLFLAMFLGWAFLYAAGTTYNLHMYLRNMRKVDEEYPEVRDDA